MCQSFFRKMAPNRLWGIFFASASLLSNTAICQTLDGDVELISSDELEVYNERSNLFPFPLTGIIKAKVEGKDVTLKVGKKIHRPAFCNRIEFVGTPHPNSSPLIGSSTFTLNSDELFNDRYSWSNGVEYLSYIKYTDHEFGNWIVGNQPGVDSGFVFIKTTEKSVTPMMVENENNHWHWLLKESWAEVPTMRAVCRDEYLPGTVHYEIDYFDQQHNHQSSILVPDINPFILAKQKGTVEYEEDFIVTDEIMNAVFPAYLDKETMRWHVLEDIQVVATFGHPYLISNIALNPVLNMATTAILVNEEHAASGGWRLTFRKFSSSRANYTLFVPEANAAYNEDDEFLIEIDNFGYRESYSVTPLAPAAEQEYRKHLVKTLRNAQVGDYVWLWMSVQESGVSSLPEPPALWQNHVEELLVKCVGRSERTLLFQSYPTNRLQQMKQPVLQKDIDLLSMTFSSSGEQQQQEQMMPVIRFKGNSMQLEGMHYIGGDIVHFIHRYLVTKEGKPNKMSSCYMYHAAVSLPQALIYAAEILCVLIGSKPVALIQYTSATEHQWKFPLVRELSQSIAVATAVYGEALDVSYAINRYKDDETLVIYRTSRKYVTESLMPVNESQALHPLPYPDSSRLNADWKLQIYYAAWNGFALGYPEFFVQSYCETFHNGLDVNEKKRQYRLAKDKFQQHLRVKGQSSYQIHLGMDKPIDLAHYEYIISNAVH